ncbi:integrase, catalytic region, zinc finger, CCHC-type containing protein [Tanacetum coccineum]
MSKKVLLYKWNRLPTKHRLESRTFEVKMNQVLGENERLLEQVIDKDIVKTVVNLSVNTNGDNVTECQKNACPLTRITTTNEVPSRKPIVLDSKSPKPVVKLVYSRKPRKNNNAESVSNTKVLKPLSANKQEPSKSWGSTKTNIPSTSLNECRLSKSSSVKFGLGHNLFSVGQFCDSNLEVAFRQHTCFIRNLEGVDLLTGSRGDNLYTLSLGNMMASSPICLLSKASKTKSWLWHRRLSHLNFGSINHLSRHGLKVGISHETSVARSLQQNGVVERRNRTLIEAARTMLIYVKAPLFLWAEAVATACYTQNYSMIRHCHGKTPYELLHDKPPDLSYLHVFGALCYPTNDSENLGKLQPKADIGIFIGYVPTKKAFWIYNRRTRRIIETINVDFDELIAMASEHSSSGPALHDMTHVTLSSGLVPNPPSSTPFGPPSRSDWDLLFQPMFDESLNPPPYVDLQAPEVIAPIPEVVAHEHAVSTGSPSSTIVDQDAPSPKELHEFKRLEVWELVPPPDKAFVISLKWIYKVKLDELGVIRSGCKIRGYSNFSGICCSHEHGHLSNGCEDCISEWAMNLGPSGYSHGGEVQMDEDKEGKAVDPSHIHLHDADHAGCQDTRHSTSGSIQLLGDRLVSWSSKRQKSAAISGPDAEYSLVGCCAQVLWMRSQSYRLWSLDSIKFPDIRFHFIKEHVRMVVIEFYFVNTEYHIGDIFTKSLAEGEELILINKLECGFYDGDSETIGR